MRITLPPLICSDGLVIAMLWSSTDSIWLAGQASGELELEAQAGEEILGRSRKTLSVEATRLNAAALREAKHFEKELRANLRSDN